MKNLSNLKKTSFSASIIFTIFMLFLSSCNKNDDTKLSDKQIEALVNNLISEPDYKFVQKIEVRNLMKEFNTDTIQRKRKITKIKDINSKTDISEEDADYFLIEQGFKSKDEFLQYSETKNKIFEKYGIEKLSREDLNKVIMRLSTIKAELLKKEISNLKSDKGLSTRKLDCEKCWTDKIWCLINSSAWYELQGTICYFSCYNTPKGIDRTYCLMLCARNNYEEYEYTLGYCDFAYQVCKANCI